MCACLASSQSCDNSDVNRDGKINSIDLINVRNCLGETPSQVSFGEQVLNKLADIFNILNFGISDKLSQIASSLKNIENKECKWEKMNYVGEGLYTGGIRNEEQKDIFILPGNSVAYKDLKFKKLGIAWTGYLGATGCHCILRINNNRCYEIFSVNNNELNFKDLSNECLSYLKEGTNTYSITCSEGAMRLRKISVEMEVLPANC